MTLYDELELTPDCSFEDIKHQYRTLAKKHHPDLGGDAEIFKRIKFAYEVLIDPARRKKYDETKTTTEFSSLRVEAINALAGIFFALIPNFNCAEGNLIETMKTEVANAKNKANADLMMCDVYIANLEIVKSKLKLKNPNEENILLAFLEKQLEARYKDKEIFSHRIKLSDEIMSILDNYEYGFLEIINAMPEPIVEAPGGN